MKVYGRKRDSLTASIISSLALGAGLVGGTVVGDKWAGSKKNATNAERRIIGAKIVGSMGVGAGLGLLAGKYI